MRMIIWAAVFSMLVGASAMADATKADWEKLGMPIVNAFVECGKGEVARMATDTTMTAEAIADAAVSACKPKLWPLRDVLMAEPFNESSAGADEGLAHVEKEFRASALVDAKQRKGD